MASAIIHNDERSPVLGDRETKDIIDACNVLCKLIVHNHSLAKTLTHYHRPKAKAVLHPTELGLHIERIKYFLEILTEHEKLDTRIYNWWIKGQRLYELLEVISTRCYIPYDMGSGHPVQFCGLWIGISYFDNVCFNGNCNVMFLPNTASSNEMACYLYAYAGRNIKKGERLTFTHFHGQRGMQHADDIRKSIAISCMTPCICPKCNIVNKNVGLAYEHAIGPDKTPRKFGNVFVQSASTATIGDVITDFIGIKKKRPASSDLRLAQTYCRTVFEDLDKLCKRAFALEQFKIAHEIVLFARDICHPELGPIEVFNGSPELTMSLCDNYLLIQRQLFNFSTVHDWFIRAHCRITLRYIDDNAEKNGSCFLGINREYNKFKRLTGTNGPCSLNYSSKTAALKDSLRMMIAYYLRLYVTVASNFPRSYLLMLSESLAQLRSSNEESVIGFLTERVHRLFILPVEPTAIELICIRRYAESFIFDEIEAHVIKLQRRVRRKLKHRRDLQKAQEDLIVQKRAQAVVVIQRQIRYLFERKQAARRRRTEAAKKVREHQRCAAIKIQRTVRFFLNARREVAAAVKIQRFMRCVLLMRPCRQHFEKTRNAIIVVQSLIRVKFAKKRYLELQKIRVALSCQSYLRGKLARSYFRELAKKKLKISSEVFIPVAEQQRRQQLFFHQQHFEFHHMRAAFHHSKMLALSAFAHGNSKAVDTPVDENESDDENVFVPIQIPY